MPSGQGAATLEETLNLTDGTIEPVGADVALTGYASQTMAHLLAAARAAAGRHHERTPNTLANHWSPSGVPLDSG